jgi:AcrR family transcriptional regulator
MEPKKISTPVQNRSKESKERIIQAALELYGTKGIMDVTTKMIAVKAEVAIGTLYVYFRDKKDITKAVLERNCELFLSIDYKEILQSETNVIQAIERILSELRNSMNNWNVPFVEMQLLESNDPEIKSLTDSFNAQILALAKELISSTRLSLRPTNVDHATAYVFLVIDSYLFRLPYYHDLIDAKAMTKEVAYAIGSYLFGDQTT